MKSLILFSVLFALTFAIDYPSAINVGLQHSAVEAAIRTFVPMAQEKLTGAQLPNITGNETQLTNITIEYFNISSDDVEIDLEEGRIQVKISNLDTNISMHIEREKKDKVKINTDAYVSPVDLDFDITVEPTFENDRLGLLITYLKFSMKKIYIKAPDVPHFIIEIIDDDRILFDLINEELSRIMKKVAQEEIDKTLNNITYNHVIPNYTNYSLSIAPTQGIDIKPEGMTIYLDGTCFVTANGYKRPDFKPVTLPSVNPDPSVQEVQIYYSDYVHNSLLNAMYETDDLKMMIPTEELPSQIRKDGWMCLVFPGTLFVYGCEDSIRIYMYNQGMGRPYVNAMKGYLYLWFIGRANIDVHHSGHWDTGIDFTGHIDGSLDVSITSNNVNIDVYKMEIHNLHIVDSHIGAYSDSVTESEFQTGLNQALPIKKSIPLPPTLPIKLDNPLLTFNPDYIVIETDFEAKESVQRIEM